MSSFADLKLEAHLLQALELCSYPQPTAIQQQAIPMILDGGDLQAQAQTGTGKTAAFALPMLQMLAEPASCKKKKVSLLGLVLVPTRELALQVAESLKKYGQCASSPLKIISLIGGEDIEPQVKGLRHGADIAVATPGRLLEHLENGDARLVELQMLVLDEADKMLNLGFAEELQRLQSCLPRKRQTLLFSATLPEKVLRLSAGLLKEARELRIQPNKITVEAISQRAFRVDRDNRRPLLQHLLSSENWQRTLIFTASRKAARNLAEKLNKNGFSSLALHGDLMQASRTKALKDFREGKAQVLVATDIACRGIDIDGLSHVVNFDLPRSPADYIHRIGRTGRAGESGEAISFITEENEAHFKLIEKRAGVALEWQQLPGFEAQIKATETVKGQAPTKGKRKSKKDKAREAAAKAKKRKDRPE